MANIGCFLAENLRGYYGVSFQGVLIKDGVPLPVHATGLMFADGKGGLSVRRTLAYQAALVANQFPPESQSSTTASYTVSSDGRGTATVIANYQNIGSVTEKYEFVIDSNDEEVRFIMTSVSLPGYIPIVTGTGRRQ